MSQSAIDTRWFRQVLGHYPTGVCFVSAMIDGSPVGMVVGSFTSVSLTPPLVAFFPDKSSGTWARLRYARDLCINILSSEQEQLCRKLASRDPDKFENVNFNPSPRGTPILEGAIAWIDCEVLSIEDAGDHLFVLCSVDSLDARTAELPLLFFQGGYGKFTPSSLVAADAPGLLTNHLRILDGARSEMERIAAALDSQCVATLRVDDEVIVGAVAGQASDRLSSVSAGRRVAFSRPIGLIFAASLPHDEALAWLGAQTTVNEKAGWISTLEEVREKGYVAATWDPALLETFRGKMQAAGDSLSQSDVDILLGDERNDPIIYSTSLTPDVRLLTVPVLDDRGDVRLGLTVQGFPQPVSVEWLRDAVAVLSRGAEAIAANLWSASA